MKIIRALLIVLAVLFAVIQFFPSGLPRNEAEDHRSIANSGIAGDSIIVLLKNSCYDCHSNQTEFPWYSKVKPVAWFLSNHIKEGKEHLNFSVWEDYSTREKLGLINDIVEETASGAMPLKSYLLIHRDARLTEAEISALKDWGGQAAESILE